MSDEDSSQEPAVQRLSQPGGDVAGDPDDIQREIEQTRAELAQTIDAIADRVSPRRAAGRGASKVKATVASVLSRDDSPDGRPPAALLDTDGSGRAPDTAQMRAVAEQGGGAVYTGATDYRAQRALRVDRVLIAVGAAVAVGALVVLARRRRR